MKEMTKNHYFHEKTTSSLTSSPLENNSYIPKRILWKFWELIGKCVYTPMLSNVPILKIIVDSNPFGNFEEAVQFLNYYFSYFIKPTTVSAFDFFNL